MEYVSVKTHTLRETETDRDRQGQTERQRYRRQTKTDKDGQRQRPCSYLASVDQSRFFQLLVNITAFGVRHMVLRDYLPNVLILGVL